MSTVSKKLLLHKANSLLLLNEPEGFSSQLANELDSNLTILHEPCPAADFVLLFAKDSSVVREHLNALSPAKAGGIVWVAYPKKSSKVSSDLNRDSLFALLHEFGYQGVSLVSLDGTWSAMRVKPL